MTAVQTDLGISGSDGSRMEALGRAMFTFGQQEKQVLSYVFGHIENYVGSLFVNTKREKKSMVRALKP